MTFTKKELAVINFSMRVDPEKNPTGQQQQKRFDRADELDALTIMKQLKALTEKRIENGKEDEFFIDGDLELGTAEKSLILKCLDRQWDIDNLEMVVPLREKLA